jgi:Cytochrome C and Quinol oxidase polypeptide I
MASEAIPLNAAPSATRPIGDRLHDWVVTVDHKKLGILYILYGLVFLVIAGMEALIIRIQLMRAHSDFVSPEVFNRMFTMHGTTMIFFVVMPVLFGFATYLVPLMVGARDMAFPRLNALSFWLMAFGGLLLYFSFLGGNGLYERAGRRMVGLRPFDRAGFLSRPQFGLLDDCVADFGIRKYRHRDQHYRYNSFHALPRNDAGKNAADRLALSRHGRHGHSGDFAAYGGSADVERRSLSRRAFLRYASRRLCNAVDAFLLDFRPSGSLRSGDPRVRVHV